MSGGTLAASRDAFSIKSWSVRHPLVTFYVIAFAGAWLAVPPVVLERAGVLPVSLPAEPFIFLGGPDRPRACRACGDLGQAGRLGVRRLLARYLCWRVGVQWYLFAVFGPLAILTLGATAFLGPAVLANLAHNGFAALATLLLGTLANAIIGGPLGEELGWRGFAQPLLERGYGPLGGLLLLGVLWGVWHRPGFFGGWLGVPFSLPAFLFIVLSGAAGSVIYGWVYNHTGSLLAAALLHASGNAALGVGALVIPVELPGGLHRFIFSMAAPRPSAWLPPSW